MTNLYDALITSTLPYDIAAKPEIKALALTFSKQLKKIMDYSDRCDFFFNLDLVDENMLDYFAIDFNVVEYNSELNIEQKRELVKKAFVNWTKAGTKSSIENIIKVVNPNFKLSEWPEYSGQPGTFRIEIENTHISNVDFETLLKYIDAKKRKSAHLDKISFNIETDEMLQNNAMAVHASDFEDLKNKWSNPDYYNNHYPFLVLKNSSDEREKVIAYDRGVTVWIVNENELDVSVLDDMRIFVEDGIIYCETEE